MLLAPARTGLLTTSLLLSAFQTTLSADDRTEPLSNEASADHLQHADPVSPQEVAPCEVVAADSATQDAPLLGRIIDISAIAKRDGLSVISADSDTVAFAGGNVGDLDGDGCDEIVTHLAYKATSGASILDLRRNSYLHIISGASSRIQGTLKVGAREVTPGWLIRLSIPDGQSYRPPTRVSGVGDVNGDGLDDMLVWASYEKTAWLLFGNKQLDRDILLDEAAVELGVLLRLSTRSITDVSAAGDLNGDGFADVLVRSAIKGESMQRGRIHVLFGNRNPDDQYELDQLNGQNGFQLVRASHEPLDGFGSMLTGVGDTNGDGVDDIAFLDPGRGFFSVMYEHVNPQPGEIAPVLENDMDPSYLHVIYGARGIWPSRVEVDERLPVPGFSLRNSRSTAQLSTAISSMDLNADGLDDILVSTRTGQAKNPAITYVVWGKVRTKKIGEIDDEPESSVSTLSAFDETADVTLLNMGDLDRDSRDDLALLYVTRATYKVLPPHVNALAIVLNSADIGTGEQSLEESFDSGHAFWLNSNTSIEPGPSRVSVGSVGDVDGDGFDDFSMTHYTGDIPHSYLMSGSVFRSR